MDKASFPSQDRPAVAEDIDEPHDDRPERTSAELNALEATELNRLRLQYSRVSSHRPAPSTLTPKPTTLFGRSIYAIKKFWRHQISVKVDHSTCRDHLGVCVQFSCFSLGIDPGTRNHGSKCLAFWLIAMTVQSLRDSHFMF